MALSGALLPLNSTMLAVALPDIASGLGSGVAATTWLVTAYVVAMAVLGPFAGRLGDRHGRRRVVLWGLGSFAVASLAAGLAPSLPVLVAARLGQAVAGSLVVPQRDRAAPRRAARTAVAPRASGCSAPPSAPPPRSARRSAARSPGWLGWRAIFLVNLPVVAAAVVLTLRRSPAVAPARYDAGGPSGGDVEAAAAGPGVRRGDRAPSGLSNLSMYATLLAVPVVLSHRPGWSTADAGLALAMLSVAMVAVAPLGGRLADRRGHRIPAVAGWLCSPLAAAGLAAMGGRPVRRRAGRGAARRRRSGSASPTRRCRPRRSRPSTRATPASRPGCTPRAATPGASCPRRCSQSCSGTARATPARCSPSRP